MLGSFLGTLYYVFALEGGFFQPRGEQDLSWRAASPCRFCPETSLRSSGGCRLERPSKAEVEWGKPHCSLLLQAGASAAAAQRHGFSALISRRERLLSFAPRSTRSLGRGCGGVRETSIPTSPPNCNQVPFSLFLILPKLLWLMALAITGKRHPLV